jgi:hypothetical protein
LFDAGASHIRLERTAIEAPHTFKMGSGSSKSAATPTSQVWTA